MNVHIDVNVANMLFTYDPVLVLVSIVVATVGAFTCFDLVVRIRRAAPIVDKKLLVGSALAMGGSIWAMHFVAMLAVQLPIIIRYDILTTLISVFVAVLMTALALIVVTTSSFSISRIAIAGTFMGFGISGMHYVGMSAIRGNCVVSYEVLWVGVSVVIGVAASMAALWFAMTLHGNWRKTVASVVMGISVSGMHYTGMAGTSFEPINSVLEFTRPILSSFSLGLVTAIATFVILGGTLLLLVPENRSNEQRALQTGTDDNGFLDHATAASAASNHERNELAVGSGKLPVQKDKKTYFIDFAEIVCVTSNGHYTTVHTVSSVDGFFCNYPLSEVAERLDPQMFVHVHRRHIVNLQHVESFKRDHGNGELIMRKGQHRIPVSRANLQKVQDALGI